MKDWLLACRDTLGEARQLQQQHPGRTSDDDSQPAMRDDAILKIRARACRGVDCAAFSAGRVMKGAAPHLRLDWETVLERTRNRNWRDDRDRRIQ